LKNHREQYERERYEYIYIYIYEGQYLLTTASLLAVHQSYKTKTVIPPIQDITLKVELEIMKKTLDAHVAPECMGYKCCYRMYLSLLQSGY
jgi:hypothetical protein